jgi:hypothetical protein
MSRPAQLRTKVRDTPEGKGASLTGEIVGEQQVQRGELGDVVHSLLQQTTTTKGTAHATDDKVGTL